MKDFGETLYAIALSITAQPGLSAAWKMIASKGPEELYELLAFSGEAKTQPHLAEEYSPSPVETAHWILEKIRKLSVEPVHYWEERYPPILREISVPPVVLYARGDIPHGRALAMVGTRKPGREGKDIARRLSRECAAAGFVIVSGMAIGIDREAHLGALDVTGATIGVLANGIDRIYPSGNRDLFSMIDESENSCLVSEYPPGLHAEKWTFVRRNRIISGMAAGCVVVQAPERSGALITARHALEQNREVFACTGYTFDPAFRGCHNLIQEGAVPVSDTRDVLSQLMPGHVPPESNEESDRHLLKDTGCENLFPGGSTEGRILELLDRQSLDIDTIIRKTGDDAGLVNRGISELEINGYVSRVGNRVKRIA